MSAPCPHGMPTPGSCTDCMYEGNVAPPPRPEPERTAGCPFAAGYDGDCPGCGHLIHAGQLIRRTTRGRYVHEGCTP